MRYFINVIITVLISGGMSVLVSADGNIAAEITEQNAKYMAAFNAGDVNALMRLHTKDVRTMMPGQPVAVGREAVRTAIAAETSGPAKLTLHLAATDVHQAGETAYEKGRWTMLVQPDGAEDVTDGGPYLVVWKKVDGEWLIHFDAVFPGQAPSKE